MRCLAVLAAFMLLGAAPPDGELVSIPMPATPDILAGRVCAPSRGGPWKLVVLNHGSPASADQRAAMQPASCASEPVRWFTQRGFLVVASLRRGFGLSTGRAVEDSGICDEPDYARSGLLGAEDIDATLRFALARKDVRPDRPVIVGQSTGGWATIAYDGPNMAVPSIFISFAGGRGAHAFAQPPTNCRPDLLIEASATLGARARAPMLWVSAANDSYFPTALMQAMQRAYNQAGGEARLAALPAFGREGHALLQGEGGSKLWGNAVERYLVETRAGS
jgi:dienelactone hydrolase